MRGENRIFRCDERKWGPRIYDDCKRYYVCVCFYFILHIEWPSMHIKSVRNHLLLKNSLFLFFAPLVRSCFDFDYGCNRWGTTTQKCSALLFFFVFLNNDKFSAFMCFIVSVVWGFLDPIAHASKCDEFILRNARALHGSFNIRASDCECVFLVSKPHTEQPSE